jgi:hypothetical protein
MVTRYSFVAIVSWVVNFIILHSYNYFVFCILNFKKLVLTCFLEKCIFPILCFWLLGFLLIVYGEFYILADSTERNDTYW